MHVQVVMKKRKVKSRIIMEDVQAVKGSMGRLTKKG